jgi:NADH-quinone oxidoreductase subunit E
VSQAFKKNSREVQEILARYPQEHQRAAVMPLLHLVQREDRIITREAMAEIAGLLEIDVTEVASVVGFYTLFHDLPGGQIRIQVCTDVACTLRGAREYTKELCEALGIHAGETTSDGMITIEEVKCLAACDRAPLFQSQIGDELEYHENQTAGRTLDWLKSMVASMPKPTSTPPAGGEHE